MAETDHHDSDAQQGYNPTVRIVPDATASRLRTYVRRNPDVVHDDYEDAAEEDPIEGACYTLAECYFHASGGQDSDLDIYCLSWSDVDGVDDENDRTHWYLKRRGGPWIDLGLPTPEDADNVPFDVGRRRAFLTGYEPSNKCERVLDDLGIDVEASSD